jgi:hypothetical protein
MRAHYSLSRHGLAGARLRAVPPLSGHDGLRLNHRGLRGQRLNLLLLLACWARALRLISIVLSSFSQRSGTAWIIAISRMATSKLKTSRHEAS